MRSAISHVTATCSHPRALSSAPVALYPPADDSIIVTSHELTCLSSRQWSARSIYGFRFAIRPSAAWETPTATHPRHWVRKPKRPMFTRPWRDVQRCAQMARPQHRSIAPHAISRSKVPDASSRVNASSPINPIRCALYALHRAGTIHLRGNHQRIRICGFAARAIP